MERCTIIVDARDRFSPTTRCLETLLANTYGPHELIVVMGGAPEYLKREWTARFGRHARFLFEPHFLNQAQARNLGLRQATTRLAVVMDNDNFVQPGWLDAMLRCEQETGAVMVTPAILETPRRLHCVGTDLYVTYEQGKAYGHKHTRYHGKIIGERTNLTRQRVDYGELHCLLVQVEPTLRLGAFDERIREVSEVDAGLSWAKGGYAMWAEPASRVLYAIDSPITVDDVRFFAWRWDMRGVLEGYRHFERKWGIDITEHGRFRDFLLHYNEQLGLLPRLYPAAWTLALDQQLGQARAWARKWLRAPAAAYGRVKAKLIGYYEWPVRVEG